MCRLPLSGDALAQMTVDTLLDVRDAVERDELRVLLHAAINRQADLPGPREHVRVFNRRVVLEMLRARRGDALDHMQRVAVEVAGAVEPREIVEASGVDDQRLALP